MPGDPELLPVFAARRPVDMHLPMTWGDLVSVSTLTPGAAAYLDAAVRARLTILVTGEARTGRTIMLNVLGAATSDSFDNTYAIERLHYLTFHQLLPFASSVQTTPVVDASGDRTPVRELVRHLVKMQAERIVADDVIEDAPLEVWELVRRCHGSMFSLAAPDPRTALGRLVDLVSNQSHPDVDARRTFGREVTNEVDLVVHMTQPSDTGAARVGEIFEVDFSDAGFVAGQVLYERSRKGELFWRDRVPARTSIAISEGVPHLLRIRDPED